MMRNRVVVAIVTSLAFAAAALAGSLTPPAGPVTGTMKPLDIVEPRTPISSLPFTISTPGSYYITQDLTGVAGQHGITISASAVSLDLNGFTLRGVPGSLNGVHVPTPQIKIWVGHGFLCGWGGAGLQLAFMSRGGVTRTQTDDNDCGSEVGDDNDVMYMIANNNANDGLIIGSKCVAKGLSACGNGGIGIKAGGRCNLSECESSANGSHGICTGDACTITSCTTGGNGGIGIKTEAMATVRGGTIIGCTANQNTSHGILAGGGTVISECSAGGNGGDGIVAGANCSVTGCTLRSNTGDGVECSTAATVARNQFLENGAGAGDGAGIHVVTRGGGCRLEENNLVSNDRGIDVDSTGNLIIKNSVTGTGTPFTIVAGNTVGTILSVGGDGSFSSANCWANLIY